MSKEEISVDLIVDCEAVGDKFAVIPDQLLLTITPPIMERLERLMAYQEKAKALFDVDFPEGKDNWFSAGIMFPHFEPASARNGGDDEEYDRDASANPREGEDLRIDCEMVEMREGAVVLTASIEELGCIVRLR